MRVNLVVVCNPTKAADGQATFSASGRGLTADVITFWSCGQEGLGPEMPALLARG